MSNILVEILSKVDDCVLQVTIAAYSLALAACLVLLRLLSSAHHEITWEPATAFHAFFKVGIAVDLGYLLRVNTTPEVKAINVLADNTLQESSILKLNESHVCSRWSSF